MVPSLRYHLVRAGDVCEGDVFVDEDWKESGLWGRRVGKITFVEDGLTDRFGRLVSLSMVNLAGDTVAGLSTRENNRLGVLR